MDVLVTIAGAVVIAGVVLGFAAMKGRVVRLAEERHIRKHDGRSPGVSGR